MKSVFVRRLCFPCLLCPCSLPLVKACNRFRSRKAPLHSPKPAPPVNSRLPVGDEGLGASCLLPRGGHAEALRRFRYPVRSLAARRRAGTANSRASATAAMRARSLRRHWSMPYATATRRLPPIPATSDSGTSAAMGAEPSGKDRRFRLPRDPRDGGRREGRSSTRSMAKPRSTPISTPARTADARR